MGGRVLTVDTQVQLALRQLAEFGHCQVDSLEIAQAVATHAKGLGSLMVAEIADGCYLLELTWAPMSVQKEG